MKFENTWSMLANALILLGAFATIPGLLFDSGGWAKLARIPHWEVGPTPVYGLLPFAALCDAWVLMFWAPEWIVLPILFVVEHLLLVRACRRHEDRRRRFVDAGGLGAAFTRRD